MIIIDKQTPGRFGNKIFHYNSLVQLSSLLGQDFLCADWDASSFFSGIATYGNIIDSSAKEIEPLDLVNLSEDELKERYSEGNFKLSPLSLCGPYFRLSKKDPRSFLKIEKKVEHTPDIDLLIGVHIRGGDTRGDVPYNDGNNGRETHPAEYYIKAIETVLEEYSDKKLLFCVCTDDPDPNFNSFSGTMKYLHDNGIPFFIDTKNGYLQDFLILSSCDILIAGSSTFVLAAGMLGKQKRIIHSKEFVEQFKDEDQKWYSKYGNGMFFHDLNHMKNEYYDLWKLL